MRHVALPYGKPEGLEQAIPEGYQRPRHEGDEEEDAEGGYGPSLQHHQVVVGDAVAQLAVSLRVDDALVVLLVSRGDAAVVLLDLDVVREDQQEQEQVQEDE